MDENTLTASDEAATSAETAKVETTEAKTENETKSEVETTSDGEGKSDQPDKKADESDDAKPKPKSRAQERIEGLSRDKRNLQRQVARLNRELGKLQAEKLPDTDDPVELAVARATRANRESDLRSQFETASSEIDDLRVKRQDAWADRVAEARERMPDFDQVFHDRLPVSEVMAELLVESDQGPEIAYYLGKNPHEARRIAEMPPVEAAREIGRLEMRLTAPKPKTVSSAPKPVPTVSGKSSTSASRPVSELASNMDEYARYWEQREGLKTG